MAEIRFTSNLKRHLSGPSRDVAGATVAEALHDILRENPRLRHHVLDDEGRLRKQIVVFLNGALIEDRRRLSDPIDPASELYVVQAGS
jgi:hypothetical protein